jgi:NAD kinase
MSVGLGTLGALPPNSDPMLFYSVKGFLVVPNSYARVVFKLALKYDKFKVSIKLAHDKRHFSSAVCDKQRICVMPLSWLNRVA